MVVLKDQAFGSSCFYVIDRIICSFRRRVEVGGADSTGGCLLHDGEYLNVNLGKICMARRAAFGCC